MGSDAIQGCVAGLGFDNWPQSVQDELRRSADRERGSIPFEEVFVADLFGKPVINFGSCLSDITGHNFQEITDLSIAEIMTGIEEPNGNGGGGENDFPVVLSDYKLSPEKEVEITQWLHKRYGQYMETGGRNGNGHSEREVVLPTPKSPKWKGHACVRKQVRSRLGKL